MCIGAGSWTWITRRGANPDEVKANRPRSGSYGSEANMVYDGIQRGRSTRVTAMMELPKAKLSLEHHATKGQEIDNLDTPRWLRGVDKTNVRGAGNPPRLAKLPIIRLPSPRFEDFPRSLSLQSASHWSLFPRDERPYSAPSTRLDVPGSTGPHFPYVASAKTTTNLSLTNLAPKPVSVMHSPSYAASEYASIHRNSKRISNQSAVSEAPPLLPPPLPPPKTPSPPPKSLESPLPTTKSIITPQMPPMVKQPRPMSFKTFIAQAQGRTPLQKDAQESFIRPPMPPTPPMSPDLPTAAHRKSHRTSFKSYIRRNELGDEGIFVATSDDPDVPFTFFQWPNDSTEVEVVLPSP